MHGGGPPVVAGKPLDKTYKEENVELVTKGCCNLARHIANARAYGVPVVVAVNKFASDTDAELEAVRSAAMEAGAPAALCFQTSAAESLQRPSHQLLKLTTGWVQRKASTSPVQGTLRKVDPAWPGHQTDGSSK